MGEPQHCVQNGGEVVQDYCYYFLSSCGVFSYDEFFFGFSSNDDEWQRRLGFHDVNSLLAVSVCSNLRWFARDQTLQAVELM